MYAKISELKKNPNNPRIVKDEGFKKLKASLSSSKGKEHFEARPCIVSTRTGENIIIAGNTRYQAAKDLGWQEVPVVIMEELTEEQEQEIIIRDNVTNGEWNWEQLANEWDSEKLAEWGVDLPEIETIDPEAQEDDYEIPEEVKTDIVLGDLFEIGEHRLLCGDSTDSDAVAKLMNGQKADMVFTDPPYDMQMKGGCVGDVAKNMRKVEKDIEFISTFNPTDFLNTLPMVFENKKMNAYIFCNKDLVPKYLNFAIESKYNFNILIWKKPNAIPLGDSHYPDVEYLLLFRKSAIWNNGLKNVSYSRCLEFGRESGLHPTMKPIELISNEMQISSNKNSLVFDFFLGSGSTMVASHQLNRKCYGMELDPKYCQVILDRMRKLDPSLVIKKNGVVI
jgi:site-specific DNA-methyltransferase (adenine-specific)